MFFLYIFLSLAISEELKLYWKKKKKNQQIWQNNANSHGKVKYLSVRSYNGIATYSALPRHSPIMDPLEVHREGFATLVWIWSGSFGLVSVFSTIFQQGLNMPTHLRVSILLLDPHPMELWNFIVWINI